jgi:hypothetical protein
MNTDAGVSREIDGHGRAVRELLANRKYSIDYYQREYKWQRKQVGDLIDDLVQKLLDSYAEGDERDAVARYGHYFLGSVHKPVYEPTTDSQFGEDETADGAVLAPPRHRSGLSGRDGGRMIIVETFERGGAPRGPPSPQADVRTANVWGVERFEHGC